MKNTAIVLAGGSGSRMKSSVKKQYIIIGEKPVICYSLEAFQDCQAIDEIILVCAKDEIEQCRKNIIEKYGYTKVRKIVAGGSERYYSVYEGLKAAESCDYVLIHDGARPFIDGLMLERILGALPQCRACVVGMPVKDTIKLSDRNGYVEQTLPREKLWMIQTPQSFEYYLIRDAYDRLIKNPPDDVRITDDAMVAEYIARVPVKLIEGSYENIKITTPDDLMLAETILRAKRNGAENIV